MKATWKGEDLGCGYRADLVVEDKVLIEAKSVDQLGPLHEAQLLTYIRLSDQRLGLLINFGAPRLQDGLLRRVV